MSHLPHLTRSDWERCLKTFGFTYKKQGNLYTTRSASGVTLTVHFPHGKDADPQVVRKWIGYMRITPEMFMEWWKNK